MARDRAAVAEGLPDPPWPGVAGTGRTDERYALDMRIAIDARELVGRPTGVGRYLAEILRAGAISRRPRTRVRPVRPGLRAAADIAPRRGHRGSRKRDHVEQLTLPRLVARSGADVLFAPGYTGPVLGSLAGPFSGAGVPMVVTIHDVSFAAHPEWFSWREGRRRRIVTRLTARKAARVITVSDFSKQEIVRHLGVSQARVEVIYSGITRMTPEGPSHSDGDATVLFVGSLFNRRHIPELLSGFARVAARHPSVRLVLVGDNRTRPHIDVDQLIAHSPARDRISARAYVGDADLASLYQQARAFVFLSEYEGFAMTPLEALGSGAPVVLLDTEVAREYLWPGSHLRRTARPRAHCRGPRAGAVR